MTAPSEDKFTLVGGDADFGSRAKNIFAGLESLEAQHVAAESSESAIRESYALMKPDPTADDLLSSSSRADGSAANFQVPSRPPPKRTIRRSPGPGYETSPSKWKRYDLSDVPVSQMSEHSNQQAARDFLSGLRGARSDNSAEISSDSFGDTDPASTRHVFCKPQKRTETKDDTTRRQPDSVDHPTAEHTDGEPDVSRTQILSFVDDEPPSDGRQTHDAREKFRRKRRNRTSDRQVRSQVASSDDDEEEEEDSINRSAKTGQETASGDEKGLSGATDNGRGISDSESDSDNFSELAQLGSDSGQEEEERMLDDDSTRGAPQDNSDFCTVEKYGPEDVDLDSID